ncbi:hypothetical protein [Sphingomonas sp. PvP056]|jgi:hypothetical protein|uniref:DUF6916 family protein n=1 Tax=Sphingomonas sp. PvP056 TaxID=3156392 RepID=UPI0033956DD0
MRLVKPEDFQPWVGRRVRVDTAPAPVDLLLVRIERMPPIVGADFREPFSILFEGSWLVLLLDATYWFDCGRAGPHPFHVTQLIPQGRTRRYQAIFT